MELSMVMRYGRALIPSIIFNFRVLPFKQAIKLPILVYKMRLLSQKGKVTIESDNIRTGMIRLGFPRVATYQNNGITWRNKGHVVFKGRCRIGNDCYIIVGEKGTLTFGDDFGVSAGLKLTAECSITFGNHTRLGWSVVVMDTNHHPLFDMEKKRFKQAFSPIVIGDYNWFASQCYVMHGVHTPERCIFGARSIITRSDKFEPYCVHGGNPLHVLSRNVMRCIGDPEVDIIRDYSFPQN